ncbi:MAG: dUTP diphosphatase [Patescibacteria group bacterium]|nr:dUTP diphosphatase [Patescibacteria group bacterium]
MRIQIKRLDPSLPLPEYHSPGACAFDIYARETTVVPAGKLAHIPTNLIIGVPKGYVLFLSLRSSSPKKFGLLVPNAPGIIDQDYCGPTDEIKIAAVNFTDHDVTIERGVRFAQGTFVKIDQAEWQERNEISATDRGSFGSTG